MVSSLENEQMLREYDALRSEILALYSRRNQHLNVIWAGVSALIAAAAVARVPELAVLGIALTATGWIYDVHNFTGIARLSTYIEIFIEAELPGLKVHTILKRLGKVYTLETLKRERIANTLFSNYGMTAIISTFASILLSVANLPQSISRWVITIIVWVIAITAMIRAFKKAIDVPNINGRLKDRFSAIKSNA